MVDKDKSLTPLMMISILGFGIFAVVVYFLLEPRLDNRTANLAVMVCAITPGAIAAPAVWLYIMRFASSHAQKKHDAQVSAERAERESQARLASLEADLLTRQLKAQRLMLPSGQDSAPIDLQRQPNGGWEIPASWD